MLTELQKRTIQAIVNIFETGQPAGDFARVTVAPSDPGRLSFGRSQASLASGNLFRLAGEYCADPAALHARELSSYLPRLEARDPGLDSDARLLSLLRLTGADPAMHRAQDAIFDRVYWDPAVLAAQALGIETALGSGVVYDSMIHGGWVRIRNGTAASFGRQPSAPFLPQGMAFEREWITRYIGLRRDWLALHSNPLLRLTTYRMDTFAALVRAGNWDLTLPIEAHGVRITAEALDPRSAAEPITMAR